MANKNTKQRKLKIRKAGKQGKTECQLKVPSNTYNQQGMIERSFPTSILRGDTVSSNRKRNTAMRVYVNTTGAGKSQSITRHEPFLKGEPMRFKGHDYIEYRRTRAETSR